MPTRKRTTTKSTGPVEGEGSYSATRRYNEHLGRALADKRSIARGAERARRAVEGPEGAKLREAERSARRGPRAPAGQRARSR